jgi:hypothetical protein
MLTVVLLMAFLGIAFRMNMASQTLNPQADILALASMTQPYLLVDHLGNICDGSLGIIPFGVTQNEQYVTGGQVPCRFLQAGTFKVYANVPILVGQRCYTASGGGVSTNSAGIFVGRARTAATATGDIIEVEPSITKVMIMGESVVASTVITNTAVETAFSNANQTLLSNECQPGDQFDIDAVVFQVAENSTDTLRLRLYFAGTVILDTTALTFVTGDKCRLQATVTIRTDGATGTFLAVAQAVNMIAAGNTYTNAYTASTAIDTTSATVNIIKVTALQGTANAGNQVRLDNISIRRRN